MRTGERKIGSSLARWWLVCGVAALGLAGPVRANTDVTQLPEFDTRARGQSIYRPPTDVPLQEVSPYLHQCTAKRELGSSRLVPGREGRDPACPDKYAERIAEVRYSHYREKVYRSEEEGLRMAVTLKLLYRPGSNERLYRFMKLMGVCLRNYFRQIIGADLDLTMVFNPNQVDKNDTFFWVADTPPPSIYSWYPSNSRWVNVVGYEQHPEKFRDENVCGDFIYVIHEFMHKLNLWDGYPDPKCPNRKIRSSRNLMRESQNAGSILEEDDIKTLFQPYCEEATETVVASNDTGAKDTPKVVKTPDPNAPPPSPEEVAYPKLADLDGWQKEVTEEAAQWLKEQKAAMAKSPQLLQKPKWYTERLNEISKIKSPVEKQAALDYLSRWSAKWDEFNQEIDSDIAKKQQKHLDYIVTLKTWVAKSLSANNADRDHIASTMDDYWNRSLEVRKKGFDETMARRDQFLAKAFRFPKVDLPVDSPVPTLKELGELQLWEKRMLAGFNDWYQREFDRFNQSPSAADVKQWYTYESALIRHLGDPAEVSQAEDALKARYAEWNQYSTQLKDTLKEELDRRGENIGKWRQWMEKYFVLNDPGSVLDLQERFEKDWPRELERRTELEPKLIALQDAEHEKERKFSALNAIAVVPFPNGGETSSPEAWLKRVSDEVDLWFQEEHYRFVETPTAPWRSDALKRAIQGVSSLTDPAARDHKRQEIDRDFAGWNTYAAKQEQRLITERARRKQFFKEIVTDTEDLLSTPSKRSGELRNELEEDWSGELIRRARFNRRMDEIREANVSLLRAHLPKRETVWPGIFPRN